MSKRSKVIAGVLVAVVLLVAAVGASTVLAQGRSLAQRIGGAYGCGGDGIGIGVGGVGMGVYGPMMDESMVDIVAEALGVSADDLIADLRSGESLADIIAANGKTVEDVTAYVLAEREADLAEAVADGRITQEQADLMLERMEPQIDSCLDGEIGGWLGRGCELGETQNGTVGYGRGMMGRGFASGTMGRFYNQACN